MPQSSLVAFALLFLLLLLLLCQIARLPRSGQEKVRGEVGVWPPRDDTDFPSATITADSEDLLNILLDKHGGVFCPQPPLAPE